MLRRRGQGLDLKIIVGDEEFPLKIDGAMGDEAQQGAMDVSDEEAEDEKLMDLAPEVKDSEGPEQEDPEHADEARDKELIGKMLGEATELPMQKKAMAMKAAAVKKKPLGA